MVNVAKPQHAIAAHGQNGHAIRRCQELLGGLMISDEAKKLLIEALRLSKKPSDRGKKFLELFNQLSKDETDITKLPYAFVALVRNNVLELRLPIKP